MRAVEFITEAKISIRDQIMNDVLQDGGKEDDYFVRSTHVDRLGYSTKQVFGRSPDVDDPNFSVDYIGYGKGKPALWFYPLKYYLKNISNQAYATDMPHVWLVKLKPNVWLQPVKNDSVVKQDAPNGKERVGILRQTLVPAAIFFKPAFDVVGKYYDYGKQHKRHGEVKGPPPKPKPKTLINKIRDFFAEEEAIKLRGFGSSEKVKEFIAKVNDMYPQSPLDPRQRAMTWGEGNDMQFAIFELVPSMSKRDAVEVKWIQAYPLRQGVGGKAMKQLQDLARQEGISLTLYPWDKGTVKQGNLIKFYKKQGFKPTNKGAKNMYWDPNEEGIK